MGKIDDIDDPVHSGIGLTSMCVFPGTHNALWSLIIRFLIASLDVDTSISRVQTMTSSEKEAKGVDKPPQDALI
jgi:hypothetical protein